MIFRSLWVPFGGILLAACSNGSAPLDVGEQRAALATEAKSSTPVPAPSEVKTASTPVAAPSASGEGCRTPAPTPTERAARAAAAPSSGAAVFDGDRAASSAERERDDRLRSEDAYRLEKQAEDAELAKNAPPKSAAETKLDEQRALVAQAKELAFEQALAAEKSHLDALGEQERLAAYSALKDRYLGGGK